MLSSRSFNNRRDALTAAYESGAYLKAPENKGQAPPNPMTDPNAMEGMMGAMKGQMAMIIPNTLIMSWINAFFSGYVISTCNQGVCSERLGTRRVMLTQYSRSEIAVSFDHQVQEHAPGRRSYEGHGSPVDVKHLLVFPLLFWTAACLQLYPWERQRYVPWLIPLRAAITLPPCFQADLPALF